ncbi:MAG TPA: aldehyde dehydrogenase family protein [Acidimicrobiia bacterium]|nr:aldehyde dehydrogenase family protein [Acidimicrobiia bacterium]
MNPIETNDETTTDNDTTDDTKAAVIESWNPATGELVGTVPDMDDAQVRQAVQRARSASREWAALSVEARVEHLRAVGQRIVERMDDLVDVVCAETGKTKNEAIFAELTVTLETVHHLVRQAPKILREQRVSAGAFMTKRAVKWYEPYGVVGVISPWNYPFTLTMAPVLTALAAGNTVVLKPSEVTPLVGLAVGDLFRDTPPYADIVQVVTGRGGTGEALVRGGVDKVSFTGSVATGRKVMQTAADSLTPVLLELGGKDPMIVCDDADVERAAGAAVWGAFFNAGQTCISVERVYATEAVYDEFVAKVVEKAKTLEVGRDLGSMTFPPQRDKVEAHLADAVAKGARVLVGGRRPPGAIGLQFEPTVVVDVTHDMDLMRDETFGPVLPIMKVRDEEEALRLANDTSYGLDSSVFTTSNEKGEEYARRLSAGTVCVNDVLVNYALPALPFGGYGESGFGRAHGEEGLLEMSRVKGVAFDRFGSKREPHWFLPPRAYGVLKRVLRLRHGKGRRRLTR